MPNTMYVYSVSYTDDDGDYVTTWFQDGGEALLFATEHDAVPACHAVDFGKAGFVDFLNAWATTN